MVIDIAAVKSCLHAENTQLHQARNAYATLSATMTFDEFVLSGYAFGKMRAYCSNTLSTLAKDMQHAIDEKVSANHRYESLLDSYFPGMSYVCLEDIENQLRDVVSVRQNLRGVLDNPFVRLATLGLSGYVDDLLQGPLKHLEASLQGKIFAFNEFLARAQGCYNEANAMIVNAHNKLREAQSVWSEEGGYSYGALCHVCGYMYGSSVSAGVPKAICDPYEMEHVAYGDPYGNFLVATTAGTKVYAYNYFYGEGNGGNQVSCTYYTLRRLRERGLDFPFSPTSDLNGGNWVNACSLGGEYKSFASSNEAIFSELTQRHGNVITNVVMSFSGGENGWGHVLLIDSVVKTGNDYTITFSDMSYQGREVLRDHLGSLGTRQLSLAEFNTWYSPASGAVLIGGPTE